MASRSPILRLDCWTNRAAGSRSFLLIGAVALFASTLLAWLPAAAAEGPGLIWSSYLGGSDSGLDFSGDNASSVALDSEGNVFVAGTTLSDDFPVTPGAFDTVYDDPGGELPPVEGFVAKFDPTGSQLLWCTFLGGIEADRVEDLSLDSAARPVVTGSTSSPNFQVTSGLPPVPKEPR